MLFGVLSNPHSMARAVSLASSMADRYIDLDRLGAETFKLDDYEAAMEKLKRGEISKAVFEFS